MTYTDDDSPDYADVPEPDEPAPQSFVLRIWSVQEPGQARSGWYGRITHVPSGRYVYVRSFSAITWFIAEYLDAMQVRLPLVLRARRWLGRRRCERNRYTGRRRAPVQAIDGGEDQHPIDCA